MNAALHNGSESLAVGIIRLLSDRPTLSELNSGKALGIGGGRAELSVCALSEKGILKVRDYRIGLRTSAYLCVVRPKGERVEDQIVCKRMPIKRGECGALRSEMVQLQRDFGGIGSAI